MKIPVLLRLTWVAQRSVARKAFQIAPLAQTQAERLRRLALQPVSALNKGKKAVRNCLVPNGG